MTKQRAIKERIDDIDELVDQWWEQWRGNASLNRLFYAASNLGDFSLIWHIVGGLRGLKPGTRARSTTYFSSLMAAESLLVNQGIKRLFRRKRPGLASDNPTEHQLREPLTSSFPSGHASAAFCASVFLSKRSKLGGAWHVIATVVALSRVHVKLHHASDVVAGACVGAVLGKIGEKILPAE